MAYVTRVRRGRVPVDELVRRVAEEESRCEPPRRYRWGAEPAARPSPAPAIVAGR